MSAILAEIDINDLATPKLHAVKDALSDLTSVQEQFARSANGLSGYVNAGVDALGSYVERARSMAQGLRDMQSQTNATVPAFTKLLSAVQAYVSSLGQATGAHGQFTQQLQLIAAGLSGLAANLTAGASATAAQAAAFRELTAAAQAGNGFTTEQAKLLADLNAKVQQNLPLTAQEIQQLQQLAQGYAAVNRAGTALVGVTQAVAAGSREATAATGTHVQALAQLAAQLQAGVRATAEQATAFAQLATAAREGNGFTAEQARLIADLNTKVQQGLALTQQEVAQFQQLAQTLGGLAPAYAGANAALVNYLAGLKDQQVAEATVRDQIALLGGTLGALATTLRESVTLTQQEAEAFKALAAAAQAGNGFTADQAAVLAELNTKIQQGLPLTAQEIQQLQQLAQSYSAAHGEVMGFGTATEQLIAIEKEHEASIRSAAQTLTVLQQGLRAGVQATQLQAQAFNDLAAVARAGTGFTAEQAKVVGELNARIQQGIPLTQQEIAQLEQLAKNYALTNREALGLGTATQRLIADEQAVARAIGENAQALSILQRQMQSGTQVTTAQAAALQQLAQAAQQGQGFTTQQATQMQRLASVMQSGTQVTAAQAQQLNQLTQGFLQHNNIIGKTTSSWQQGVAQAVALSYAIGALGDRIYALFKGSAELAARVETLSTVEQITAKNAHVSAVAMEAEVQAVRKLGITTREAKDGVIQFVQANFELSKASKLARAAQDLAVVAGENSSQTYNRLLRAIQTLQPELLRQVGITTTVNQVMQAYAVQTGQTVKQLSQAERQQAMLNYVLEQAQKSAGAYEASMETVGKQLTSFARYVEEAEVALGRDLVPTLGIAVRTGTELLKWFTSMDPATRSAVVAIGSVVVALTTLLATFRTLQLLNVGALFAGLLGPLGAVIALVGVGVGAWAYYTAATRENTEEVQAAAAAHSDEAKKLEDAHAKVSLYTQKLRELKAQGRDTSEAQDQLNKAVDTLVKLAPGLIDKTKAQTGEYGTQEKAVRDLIAAKRDLAAADIKALQLDLDTAKKRVEAAQREVDAAGKAAELYQQRTGETVQVGAAREQNEAITQSNKLVEQMGPKVGKISDAAEKARNSFMGWATWLASGGAEATKTATALRDDQKTAGERLTTQQKLLENAQKYYDSVVNAQTAAGRTDEQTKNVKDTLKAWEESTENWAERLKLAGTTIERLEGMQPKDLQPELDRITEKWNEQQKKIQEWKTAYQNALEAARGENKTLTASLAAVNQALSEVKHGSDEYNSRLVRGKATIEAYNKLTDQQKAQYKAIGVAARELEQIELDRTFNEWSKAGAESAHSVREAWQSTVMQLQAEFRTALRQTSNQIQQDAEDTLERVRQMAQDREDRLADLDPLQKPVDRAIRQEQRRVDDLIRQIQRERQARDRALAEEEARLSERFDQIRSEMGMRIAAAQQDINMKSLQEQAALRLQAAERNWTDEQLRSRLQIAEDARQQANVELDAQYSEALGAINREQDKLRKIFEMRRAANAKNDALVDAEVEKQKQASAVVTQRIREQYDEVRKVVEGFLTSAISGTTSAFTRMLTGAQSWRDGLKEIWGSVRNSFFRMVDDMIGKWVNDFVRTMLEKQTSKLAATAASGIVAGGPGNVPGAGGGTEGALTAALLKFSKTPLGGGLIAAGAGGLVGYNVGSAFNNKAAGALAGAGSGAATGALLGTTILPGIGTGVGALVGGIAGGIAGLFGAGKEAREVKKLRDELIAANGGIERLRKTARDAGFDITQMLKTKDMETFRMEATKLDTVLKFGSMDELRKKAQALGVDIERIFRIKDAEKFNQEMERLNGLLAEQQKRLEGWGTVSQGLQTRTTGFVTGLTRDFDRIYSSLGQKARTTLETAFKQAQERGFTGDRLQFMVDKLRVAAEQGVNTLNLPVDQVEEFRGVMERAQQEFNNLGKYAVATFAGVLRETGDLNAAMEAIGPTLDMLNEAQHKLGLTGSQSLDKLLEFREVLKVNEDVATSLSGITQMLKGLADAGALTQEMFTTLGNDAALQFDKLRARGVDADMAMLAMQPTLQKLWEAQDKYGYSVDATTQKLLDQASQQGLIGEKFKETNEKILDVLVSIADALGAKLPESLRTFQDQAEQTGKVAYDRMTEVAVGHSPGGVREIATQLYAASSAFTAFKDQVSRDSTVVNQNVLDMAEKFKAVKPDEATGEITDTVSQLQGTMNRTGTQGRIMDLWTAAQQAGGGGLFNGVVGDLLPGLQIARDAVIGAQPQLQQGPPIAPDIVEPAELVPPTNDPEAPAGDTGNTVTIQQGDITINLSGLDGPSILRVWEQTLRPQLQQDLERNAGQLASTMEQKLSRYRERL